MTVMIVLPCSLRLSFFFSSSFSFFNSTDTRRILLPGPRVPAVPTEPFLLEQVDIPLPPDLLPLRDRFGPIEQFDFCTDVIDPTFVPFEVDTFDLSTKSVLPRGVHHGPRLPQTSFSANTCEHDDSSSEDSDNTSDTEEMYAGTWESDEEKAEVGMEPAQSVLLLPQTVTSRSTDRPAILTENFQRGHDLMVSIGICVEGVCGSICWQCNSPISVDVVHFKCVTSCAKSMICPTCHLKLHGPDSEHHFEIWDPNTMAYHKSSSIRRTEMAFYNHISQCDCSSTGNITYHAVKLLSAAENGIIPLFVLLFFFCSCSRSCSWSCFWFWSCVVILVLVIFISVVILLFFQFPSLLLLLISSTLTF